MEVMFTRATLSEHIDLTMSEFNLDTLQFNFLRILRGTHPRPQCIREIKTKLIYKDANTTQVIQQLKDKKLIIETFLDDSKCKYRYQISNDGLKVLNKIDQKYPNYPYRLLTDIDKESMDQLLEGLNKTPKKMKFSAK